MKESNFLGLFSHSSDALGFEISPEEEKQHLTQFDSEIFHVLKDRFVQKSKFIDLILTKK